MNEQAYNDLRDAIKKALSKEDVELSDLDLDYDRDMLGDYLTEDRNLWQALNALEDDRYNDEYKGKDRAERVEEEVVARCCESFLRDSKFVRQMAEQHYRSAREITRFLKQFAKDVSTVQIDAAVRAYEGGYDTNDISPENNLLRDYADIEKIADLWVKGLREIADKRAKAKKATGEIKASQMDKVQTSDSKQWYDYSRSWKEQVDDWIAGKIPAEDTLVLGGTPSILQRVGFTALPMLVEQEHLDYWINHTYKDQKGRRRNNHNFTKEQVYQFPEKIAHPLAIIASQSTKPGVREKSIVVYIEMENKGRQIIVPIQLSYEGKQNGLKVDANLHASAYGKQSSIDELEKALKAEIDGKTEVFYINKNAISLANAPIGLAAIKALTEKVHSSDGFVHNITDNDSPVKIKSKKPTETLQFDRWFKKSKVSLKDGTPILMYHGTDGKFEAFDRRYIGAHGSFEGAGFNFAASESRAKEYANGGNVLEGWLSIQKPLSTTRKTISVNKLIDIIRKIDPTGDNVVGNYGAKDFSDYGKPSFVQRESVTAAKNIWNYAESNADIYAYLSQFNSDTESLIKAFQDEGFDGVIHYNNDGSIKTAIIFEATQFKSSDNIGLFDPKQPKFRYSIMDKDFRMTKRGNVRTFEQNGTTANVIGNDVELEGGTIRQRVAMMKLLAEHNDHVRVDAASEEEAEAFKRAGAEQVEEGLEGRGAEYGTWEFKYQRKVGQDICDPKQKVKFAKDIVKYKMPGIAA